MILLAWMAALAQQPSEVGLPVAGVTLLAPRGGLPDESLEALLRMQQGNPLNPQTVRTDLTTLFRVGDFSTVEARTEPWVTVDDQGEQVPAVNLTYVVYPAPRIRSVSVQGNQSFRTRKVLEAAGLSPGAVYYSSIDAPETLQRVQGWLRRQGYVNATVEIDARPLDDDTLDVWIRLDEGSPNTLKSMSFVGDIPPEVGEDSLRRWVRRGGLRVGHPISQDGIARAQAEMQRNLSRITGGLLKPRLGWINARTSPAVKRHSDGTVDLTWAIEPGPRLELAVRGLRWRPAKKVRDALGIDERIRLTRGFIDEADEKLERFLARKGYFAARATVELRGGSASTQTLLAEIDRGPRHSLRGRPPRKSLAFTGNEHITDAELTRVADQASSSVIRLDFFTFEELDVGLSAIRNVYRTRGYQSAELTLDALGNTEKGTRLTRPFIGAWAALRGVEPPRRLSPRIAVDEGRLTLQRAAEITGSAPDVDVSDLDGSLRDRAGSPFDPSQLEVVRRSVIERHREAGYLQAEARIRHTEEDDAVTSLLEVRPGPLVLLRSVVIRGPRVTRPSLLRRELDLELGAPLSSSDLESARRRMNELGVFSSVGTQLLGDGDTRDLLLTVTERPRWAVEAGGGVNTDQGARLIGRLTRRNLLGRAHRMDAYGLVGLAYLSDSVLDWRPDIRNIEWRAAISYTAKHVPFRNSETVVDLLLQERRQELTWRMARTGLGLSLEAKLGPKTRLQSSVRMELRNLQEVDARALLPGEAWYHLDNDADLDDSACARCRIAESFQTVLLHDRRDDPVRPTRGFLVSGIGEFSPGVALGDPRLRTPFVKGGLRMTSFLPVGGPILRLSGEVGHARGLAGSIIPLEDRYRLGGTGSLRGFRRQSIGPRNEAPRVDVDWPGGIEPVIDLGGRFAPTKWIPTGGDTTGTLIAEFLVPLPALGLEGWEGYSGALFADLGNVWLLGPGAASSLSVAEVPLVRYGIGAGIRVATPIGPLALDVASNIQAATAQGARRALLIDAWEEPPLRAHLSLGSLW